MDLLLEDWGKEATFKELTVLAKRISNFIRCRHVTMTLFRQFSPKLSLLLPAETRFGCQYLMIVVANPKWDEYVGTLFNWSNGYRAHALACQTFDGQTPAMGRAWLAMNNLKKHVFRLRDLHYVGAILNPYIFPESHELLTNSALTQFEERTGPFSPLEAPNIQQTRMLPHQWWHRVGGDALPLIAKRILSLTCSASSCEQNWSMYFFVHSKVRNRLAVKKAEDLVYIYTNSKILRERRGADPVLWYENQPFSEDSDEEVPAMYDEDVCDDDGDEGFHDGVEDNEGNGDDGGVHYTPATMDDEYQELPVDNAGGDMPRTEPVNQPNGVFDWAGFDEEAATSPHHVVNEIQTRGKVAYDRVDYDVDDEFEVEMTQHQSDDGGDNDDIHPIRSVSNNDNEGGGNNMGEQIPIPEDVEGGEEVEQLPGTLPVNVEETIRSGGLDETPPRNEQSETVRNGQEDEIPIGRLFQTPVPESTPSIGAVLAGLGRPPPPRSSTSTGHGSITPTPNTSVPLTSSGRGLPAGPSTTRRGVIRSRKGPTNVRPFFTGYTVGTTPSLPVAVGKRRLPVMNVDGITDKTKRRKVKRIVTTVVDGTIDHEFRNIHSTVEEYVPNQGGDGDDEGSKSSEGYDSAEDSREEAPDDEDIVVRVPLGMPGTRRNPERRTAKKNKKK
ncbi:hypothetical protein KC19_VG232100 [Ceratodon purpureus]|uniref:HAT C-terminal dimerisation domain-containing protein n=1 Tax=Ceratodon purpureus TaxID=3225 RepID=A0A8T0HTA9_CERPU|nr:hypothetical protein KC19_VG232100 [Ceratodon purpureus]